MTTWTMVGLIAYGVATSTAGSQSQPIRMGGASLDQKASTYDLVSIDSAPLPTRYGSPDAHGCQAIAISSVLTIDGSRWFRRDSVTFDCPSGSRPVEGAGREESGRLKRHGSDVVFLQYSKQWAKFFEVDKGSVSGETLLIGLTPDSDGSLRYQRRSRTKGTNRPGTAGGSIS